MGSRSAADGPAMTARLVGSRQGASAVPGKAGRIYYGAVSAARKSAESRLTVEASWDSLGWPPWTAEGS